MRHDPRAFLGVGLVLTVAAAAPARAQCPDGSMPPCDRPARPAAPPLPPPIPVTRRITSTGAWHTPVISPRGDFILFRSQAEGHRVRLQGLGPGARALVVFDSADVARNGMLYRTTWAADGSRFFIHGDSAILSVPVIGGAARTVWRPPAPRMYGLVSHAGDRVAAWDSLNRSIVLVTLATGHVDTVPVPGNYLDLLILDWSPDGEVLVTTTVDSGLWYSLHATRLRSRASRVLVRDSTMLTAAWSGPARAIYYRRTLTTLGLGRYQLWKLPVSPSGTPTGPPRMVIPLVEGQNFSLSETGAMAFDRLTEAVNIRVAAATGDTTSRWLTTGTAINRRPVFSPDGRRVAFIREDGASANLWVTPSDSSAPEQLTFFDERIVFSHAWSPDGERIAFCQMGPGRPRVGIVTVATRYVTWPRTLTASAPCQVAWLSRDEVLYWRPRARNFGIVSLAADQPPRHLLADDTTAQVIFPRVDPTGRYVAIGRSPGSSGRYEIWLDSRTDSSRRRIWGGQGVPVRWSAAGDAVYGTVWPSPRYVRIPLAAPDSATSIPMPQRCLDHDLSPDGTRAVCAERTERFAIDVWLTEDFDPEWPASKPAR